MYPIKLKPVFRDYIWGGNKLKNNWNKESDLDIIAESWELSCHKDGDSIICNGEFEGLTLNQLIDKEGKEILGTKSEKFDDFPILIKLIDAFDNLSVQVHPDNEYALKFEKQYGKTEMWYILDCDPNSSLLFGFNKNISKNEFKERINNNTLLDIVNKVPVKKGDVFFIEAGTLHAIGKGILILEIQQNSNCTYRIYDFDRKDKNGNKRELHVDKALDVTNLNKLDIEKFNNYEILDFGNYSKRILAKCEYFETSLFETKDNVLLNSDNSSFHSIISITAGLILESENGNININKGDSIFIKSNFGNYRISGTGKFVLTHL